MPEISLTGHSGQTYKFNCYAPQTGWNAVPGCYAFITHAFVAGGGSDIRVHYIGQTDSFQRRMREHQDDKWASAARDGANLVLALTEPNEATRVAIEQDLIQALQPKLNAQHAQPDRLAQRLQPPKNRLFGL